MTKSNLQTTIFNYKTPEFFINMKDIPPPKSELRGAFISEEKRKCREGINVNGVDIPGELYFHLNYYHLQGDNIETDKKQIMLPNLRDNEWIIFNDYHECYLKKIIYPLFGARQIAKSEIETSLTLREICLFKETEAMAIFSNSPDRDTFTKKLSTAITHGEKFIIVPPIDKDFSKDEIRFGFTKPDNTTEIRARLYIYNTQDGKKIQIGSGKSISFLLFDEIAKALRHGSKIYYEDRIDVIENVKVGDKIYGQDGKLTNVVGVFPQGEKQLYKVTLRDGRQVECCGEHLWEVYDTALGKYKVLDTNQLYKTNNLKQVDNRYNKIVKKQRYAIRKNDSLVFNEREINIEPYYLGLWLGDGTSMSPLEVTNIDNEIIEYLKKYSERLGYLFKSKGNKQHSLHQPGKGNKTKLAKEFSRLKLINNKHIPKDYLYNSFDNRMELLKGLMDSDGTCYKTGIVEFSNCNLKLVEDFEFLVRSLGINCSRSSEIGKYRDKNGNIVECQMSYTVRLFTDLNVFKLTRKTNNCTIKVSKKAIAYQERTSIVSIEPTSIDYATCIRVNNKDNLFLTNDFIVTHNSPYKAVYDVIEPALLSDSGELRCAPILAFTGGEVEKGKDAENLVKNPVTKQFKMNYENSETGEIKEIGGRLLDGLYRKDCKEPVKFSDYIGKVTNTWLDDIIINVSNKKKALEKILIERKEAEKSTDSQSLILKKIFYPLSLEDIFLTGKNNKFNINGLRSHREYLINHYTPLKVELGKFHRGKIEWTFSDKSPIDKFPIKSSDLASNPNITVAPVLIYEHPIENVPFGTYCIGVDPINNDDSSEREMSMASVYVYKRMINPIDQFKNQIVCSWTGRYKTLEEFHNLVLLMAEYYNAIEGVLIEASEMTLIQFFYHKRKAQYLAGSSDLLTHVNAKYKGTSKKGLPATTGNQRHYMNLLVEYVNYEEDIIDEDGNETIQLGLSRILDTMLLTELIEYKGKVVGQGVHDGNYDRIVAFGTALTLAQFYDIKYPITGNTPRQPTVSEVLYSKQPMIRTPFGIIKTQGQSNKSSYQPNIPRWLRK